MSKILSQQGIDAILSAARRDQSPGVVATSDRFVQACNFRTAGQLSNENARAINALHETFARHVTNDLGAYLGAGFVMGLSSVEQVSFRDFLGSRQQSGYTAPLQINPVSTMALLQVDNDLVFPMIDLLLGGIGTTAPGARELTEIDENVLEGVARLIARQLELAWQALSASIVVERCIKPTQVQQLFSPAERMLLLTFEATTAGSHGVINLLVPASFGNVLMRQTSAGPGKPKSRIAFFPKPTLRQRVLDCDFTASVDLTRVRIPVRELLALTPGSVIKLTIPVKKPSYLTIEGRELFEAVPVRSGTQRAAQLVRPVPPTLHQDVQS